VRSVEFIKALLALYKKMMFMPTNEMIGDNASVCLSLLSFFSKGETWMRKKVV
jgi:hypothetical protein